VLVVDCSLMGATLQHRETSANRGIPGPGMRDSADAAR